MSASSLLPATIRLPGPDQAPTVPALPAVLPDWTLDKIRTEFTHQPGHRPAPLWRLTVGDTGRGRDTRTPCTSDNAPQSVVPVWGLASVILAELHPDTLPTAAPHTGYGPEEQGAMDDDGWPGFFHRTHRLLHGEGHLPHQAAQAMEILIPDWSPSGCPPQGERP